MIIDKLLQVSDNQAVTVSAPSTDVIDFSQENPNIGMDGRTKMVIVVTEDVTAGGAATVGVNIQDSSNGTSFRDAARSRTYSKAELKMGTQIVIPMPTRLRRYCRVNYSVGNGPLTTGKFSAQIVTGIQQNDPYPDSPRIA